MAHFCRIADIHRTAAESRFFMTKSSLPLFSFLVLSIGCAAPLAAQSTDLKVPLLAAAKPEKKQGLSVTFVAGGKTDTRAARLVALYVPAGQSPTPFLPVGPFTATWEAEIVSDLRAEYTFSVETSGVVRATLNGAPLLDSRLRIAPQPTQLQKGANKLVVEFESPSEGDAMVRLMWASKEFPREPVPPAIFQHDANADAIRIGERLREGRLLFAQNRCVACHEAGPALPPKGEGMPELAQDAPTFDNVGAKFQEPWLAAWIADPHAIRPRTLMPKVFAGEAAEIAQRAADLAAYFVSTSTPVESKPLDLGLADQGGALFANLACVACHTKPDADGQDAHDRVPLAHMKAKWQPAALLEFLQNPAKNYAWIRMPHFRLNTEEATKIAAYLLNTASEEFPAGPKGDATRGAQLLATSNCLNCHAGVPPTTTPGLAALVQEGFDKGCLAPDPAQRGAAPDFAFMPEQRAALTAFAAHGFDSLKQDAPAEFAARQMKNLRCNACHAGDGQPSVWSQLEEEVIALQSGAPLEEGEGHPIHTTALPELTWFGEKLRNDYTASFIAGKAADKPRPWIVSRMPGFAACAEPLATGFAHQHGFSATIMAEAALEPDKVKNGETLLGENGGFNCLQCHTLGERAATAVFEAPGPNLALTPVRLRKEYFHRWVLAPTRIDPETKMPKFADDKGETPLTDFYKGNATEQFEAMWQYLQTFRK
jgi:mono/diheme cytochrome c family protein